MRFKVLLWVLGFVLERASRTNPRFQRKLEGHNLTLEIGCEGGAARHFIVEENRVFSYPGKATAPVFMTPAHEPTLAITFDSASTGLRALSGKDKQLALISGMQEQRIVVEGNPLYLMWFQSLMKLLDKKKIAGGA